MKNFMILCLLTLSACIPKEVIVGKDVPVEVKVAVAQPCVSGKRPEVVTPLNQQYTGEQWDKLDLKQKSALVSKQGLAHKTYGENINGVTISCS